MREVAATGAPSAVPNVTPSARPTVPRSRVALLLSTRYFEEFYGDGLGLSRGAYLDSYRNDWSWDWCRMLAAEGVQTAIYVATIDRGDHVITPDGYRVRFLPLGSLATPWVRFPVLGRTPVGRYVGQLANAAAMLPSLRRAMHEDGIDVLCVQEYWTARFDVLARTVQRPVIAVDQGLPDRHEFKLLKRGAFRKSAGAVVQTEAEAWKVSRYGGSARRIPNAVDTGFFSPDRAAGSGDGPEVLFIGRLHDAQKRVSDVIKALTMLPRTWRLWIAGDGPDRPALERLARLLGVSDRVWFLGFVSDAEHLRALYRRAGVVAMPSAYEGLPMVLLEAMSCGTPVVGSDIPAIAGVVRDGETGLLCPVRAPARLAEQLRRALADREQLGSAARATVLTDYAQTVVGPRLAAFLAQARAEKPLREVVPSPAEV